MKTVTPALPRVKFTVKQELIIQRASELTYQGVKTKMPQAYVRTSILTFVTFITDTTHACALCALNHTGEDYSDMSMAVVLKHNLFQYFVFRENFLLSKQHAPPALISLVNQTLAHTLAMALWLLGHWGRTVP